MRTLEDVVRAVTEIMRELGIDYVIVGGIAVSGWGNVRTTRDVGIIMDLREKNIGRLRDALKKEGFEVKVKDIEDAMREESHFTIFDTQSDYHIDAKGCYGENEKRSLKTRKTVELWGMKIFIASPEDIMAHKLVFGSEQDVRDAEGVYVRQLEKLDMDYLEEICSKMGVSRELERLKRRIGEALKGGGLPLPPPPSSAGPCTSPGPPPPSWRPRAPCHPSTSR